jgi:FdhD protein
MTGARPISLSKEGISLSREAVPLSKEESARLGRDRLIATGRAEGRTVRWHIAEEVPVSLTYDGASSVVMMATPADLEDFAYGFSVTEEMVDDPRHIDQVLVSETPAGILVDILTVPGSRSTAASRRRAIAGRTGCGLCGIESLEEAVRPPRPVTPGFPFDADAVDRAFKDLPRHQPLNRVNRSVHAAAWAESNGTIRLTREDVGRHNALDKLIGALHRQGIDAAQGFIVMSSRCSFELVQKAASAGVSCLATVSAPTTLALALAQRCGMRLAANSREGVVVFDDGQP